MLHHVIDILAQWIISVEQAMGLTGVMILMGIESACIPLPSEIIMPFAGYLVGLGVFSLWSVSLAGALGCVLGSALAYVIGAYGGRPLIEKFGKYILFNSHDLEIADRLFDRFGEAITFFSRLLPMVRTFIALPAGMARMNFLKFSLYTLFGSLPWCLGLAWLGMKLGANWESLKDRFHQLDIIVAGAILVAAVFWIRRHLSFSKTMKAQTSSHKM
jgi:membrane protein DedA with SNARE-associated domain